MASHTPVASGHADTFVADRLPPPAAWPQITSPTPLFDVPERANVVSSLFARAHAAGHAGRPMLRSPHITLSYQEAEERVNRMANWLTQDFSLVSGNRVLLRGGNTVGMALCWLAVVKAGLVAVATMPMLRAKELGEIVEKARPSAALCDAALLHELELTQARHPSLARIVCFNAPSHPQDVSVLAAAHSGKCAGCDTAASDVAMLAFTSGTTGKPKAAAQTHRDLLAACEAWPMHVLEANCNDVTIGTPPLAFTFGLGGLLLFPMRVGASVYFHDKPFTPEVLMDAVHASGASICYTAPTMYRQMAAFAKAKGSAQLRICVSAGEGLPDATRTLWREASGMEMLDGIGATEMFHIFISSAGAQVRRGAVGRVVPGYEAKVVGEDGQELPHGQVGRLAVRGVTGCKYLDDARQSAYVKDGWNYPGDAFSQDTDGYFWYQARADDMIVTAGYNVGGPEVEDCVLRHPAVAECGVVAKADPERGMLIKAYVVLKHGHAGDAALVRSIQDHVKAQLAPFKYPREVSFMERMPRTETGKLQRFVLRQMAASEASGADGGSA